MCILVFIPYEIPPRSEIGSSGNDPEEGGGGEDGLDLPDWITRDGKLYSHSPFSLARGLGPVAGPFQPSEIA